MSADHEREPAGHRIRAAALIHSTTPRGLAVLLVEPYGPPGLRLPGGPVAPGTAPHLALAAGVFQQTGLHIPPPVRLLAVDVPGPGADVAADVVLLYDGGSAYHTAPVTLGRDLRAYAWTAHGDLEGFAEPYEESRTRAALLAAETGTTAYLADGRPVTGQTGQTDRAAS
ncbi:hypothetical protein RKE29_18975 [Streptomyces sp. B1866]|uniref:hypothetical protein n=1 Tax=Streptomyces sp. B1866 TaxID=3075431 RepID=UPI00289233B7|nr:hypothetical protein [Streptomyces sp. B1866]MDT3398705.1 hypothetical protein [Streptomyces sp. B1866]